MGSLGCGGVGVSLDELLVVSESSPLPWSGRLPGDVVAVPLAVSVLGAWLVAAGWVRALVQRTPAQGGGNLSSSLAVPAGCFSSLWSVSSASLGFV